MLMLSSSRIDRKMMCQKITGFPDGPDFIFCHDSSQALIAEKLSVSLMPC